MDRHGKCQQVEIINNNREDDLLVHLHVPRSAGTMQTFLSPVLIYFCNNEDSFFSYEGEDRDGHFNTEGRKFIRDYVYVISIKESITTPYTKMMNPELTAR